MIRFSHIRNTWQYYREDYQDRENSQWIDISPSRARILSTSTNLIIE